MKIRNLVLTAIVAMGGLLASCDKSEVPGEGGNEGGNESGVLWNKQDTAMEVINGIRATVYFDDASSSFMATFENLNTVTMPQTRLEVHIFDASNNSTEFGPTTPTDMAAGETRNLSLAITPGVVFVKYNMHPEVGSGGEGSGGEGSEGGGG